MRVFFGFLLAYAFQTTSSRARAPHASGLRKEWCDLFSCAQAGASEALGRWMRAAEAIGSGRAIARAIRRDGGSKTAELECCVSMRVGRMCEGGSEGYSVACVRDAVMALIFMRGSS